MSSAEFEKAYAKMVVGKLPINDEVLYRFFQAGRESMRDEAAQAVKDIGWPVWAAPTMLADVHIATIKAIEP